MTRAKIKITGKRGQWVADAGGDTLAVLHADCWDKTSTIYTSPILDSERNSAKLAALAQALETHDRAIIQKRDATGRTGYVGVFAFTDLAITDTEIRLRITERLADPN